MLSFDVKVTDTVTPRTEALVRAYARGAHLKVMGRSAANVVKDHFVSLDRARHRGTAPFHFYGKAARATHHGVSGGKACVSIDHEGLALRRYGGTVVPRKAKWLTIPVADEAHGKRVREFGDEVTWIINQRKGTGVVLLGEKVLYALTKKTTHKADPSVLPTDNEIAKQVVEDLAKFNELTESRR